MVVVGSLAYDFVMKYDHLFSNVLLPEKLQDLSVTFPVATQTMNFGGCGGNIAYTMNLLGTEPVLMGTLGKDYQKYFEWLEKNAIDSSKLEVLESYFTACAYIMTDTAEHQITIFHVGAMCGAPEALSIKKFLSEEIGWVIIAPDDGRRMVRMAQECREMGVKYIFDPAQQIGEIPAEDLLIAISGAEILIVNEYEAELLTKRLNISKDRLETLAKNFIETRGAQDVYLRTIDGQFSIPTFSPKKIVDPTGCGDAFRGGLLTGLARGLALSECCRMGALAATYALECEGGQGHRVTKVEFEERFGLEFKKTSPAQ